MIPSWCRRMVPDVPLSSLLGTRISENQTEFVVVNVVEPLSPLFVSLVKKVNKVLPGIYASLKKF